MQTALEVGQDYLETHPNSRLENFRQIEHAILMRNKGSYGICEICAKPLGYDVLTPHPHATTHILCGLQHDEFPWAVSHSAVTK